VFLRSNGSKKDVLQYRHFTKENRPLEGSYEALAHDRMRFLTGDLPIFENDFTLIGRMGSHDQIETPWSFRLRWAR